MPLSLIDKDDFTSLSRDFLLDEREIGSLCYRRWYIYGIYQQIDIELGSHWVRNTGSYFAGEGMGVGGSANKSDCSLVELMNSALKRGNLTFT